MARPARLNAVLALGPMPLSVAWANPSRGIACAGVGIAGEAERAGEAAGAVEWLGAPPPSALPGPWFGGWAFDSARPWGGFPSERWVLPEVLAFSVDGKTWLAAFGRHGSQASWLEHRLAAAEEGASERPMQPIEAPRRGAFRQPGGEKAWRSLLEAALASIEAQRFDKVVCARVIEVTAAAPFSERELLQALEAKYPQCWSFLVRGTDGRSFIGASPELLCESTGDVFCTEALAGTSARGEGERLLQSAKNRREHLSVVEGLKEALAPYARHVEYSSAPLIKRLSNVDHLHSPFRARLKPGVKALDVARALHPTPAVAGRPKDPALQWLRVHEGFDRGWYGGAVGAWGPLGLTLAVALRCAILKEEGACVFVGAGIVEGSDVDDEWLETERKAKAILGALGVC